MRFQDIREAVPAELRTRLDTLFVRWVQRGNAETDLDAFVAWLHDQEHIGEGTFRRLHAGGSLVLWLEPEPAEHTLNELYDEATEEMPRFETAAGSPLNTGQFVAPPRDPTDEASRFTPVGKLAEGAMGEIYIARDHALMRKVALKRMSTHVAASANLSSRFMAEARITAQLDHPSIVPVYSLGPDADGHTVYTMKLVDGKTFTELIDEVRACWSAGTPPPSTVALDTRLEWFLRVCDALAYAHSRGVVHRDLKPDNVMVGRFGEVYLMDWGISRLIAHGDDEPPDDVPELALGADRVLRTRLGTVIGTPAYMSPEQAEGNNDLVDARSDQFGLGLLLYELICLQKAFRETDTIQLLLQVQTGTMSPMRGVHRRQPIPHELVAIVHRATRLDPERRYPSVQAMADDIRRYLRGEPVSVVPEGPLRRISRWVGRHRELAMLALLVLALISGTTVIGALLINQRVMQAAEAREGRISQVLGLTSDQAHQLDTRLLEVEGQLKVLAANAVDVLSLDPDRIGPEGDSYFLGEPFSPPDLVTSRRYDREVSIGWPVIKIADRHSAGHTLPTVRQVTLLRQPFRRLLLSSWSEDAVGASLDEERRLLLDAGTPIAWAYVALENGVFAHYPGHQGFPPGHDARLQDWYERVEGVRGPQWGTPHVDIGGLGLVLPCSMGLYDDDGLLLGVAGVDLTFDYVLAQWLEPPVLPGDVQTYLLDDRGRIVISSLDRGRASARSATGRRRVRLKTYAQRDVLDRVLGTRSGVAVAQGGDRERLVSWSRLPAIGWTYVLEGDVDALVTR